jgi:hypothetical protein
VDEARRTLAMARQITALEEGAVRP